MGSVYRDRDRFDDSRTTVSSTRRGGDGGYTTVKRYIVKDDDSRSSYGDRDRRFAERPTERIEETRIVRREREVEEPPRREEPRYAERELVIRRDRSEEPPRRREWDYDRRRDDVEADRELVVSRTKERDEPRRSDRELTVARYDERRDYRDDFELLSPTRRGFDDRDRDLQRYTRTAEYFSPQPQPQTIIIKQEPIIIRERVRDEDYQIVRKSDVDEERSVVRGDDRSRDRGREEEYFYEKKVKERVEEPREREDDFYERKTMRREVSPGDSVSQAGGRDRARSRGRRDYSSDDSMVYVRKEVRETSEDGSSHHRRHLAEGVIAGIGAAELLRNHKKKEGHETSGGLGRIGKDVGAGVLGAVAAEGISRARSQYRSRSRRRERSGSRETRRDKKGGRSRSRNRSSSGSGDRLGKYGKYGLGAAAIAAAALVAKKSMDKNKEPDDRRSRSRNRPESVDEGADDARNPSHRNKRMAEAGAAGAVVAGLIERARSKSRKRDGEKSPTRVRQALPVIAAGLGSAALAGVYEKNKAKRETEAAEKEKRRARSRQRSRSRPREAGAYAEGAAGGAGGAMNDPGLIEYGQGSIYGNNFSPDYYGRPAPQDGYYNDQTAVVPAGAAAAGYGAQREIRSRSDSRRRSSSRSSSSDGARRRHRHRRHEEAAAAAGLGGGAAAAEYERKKQEKRDRKARRQAERQQQQQQQEYAPYDGTYQPPHQPYTPPPPVNDPYASQSGFYPQSNQFAQPPGGQPYAPAHNPAAASGVFAPGTSYDPTSFPPPPTGIPPPTAAAPRTNENYASGGNQNPYAPRGHGGDENVSAAPAPRAFGPSFQSPVNNDFEHDQHPSVPDAGVNGMPRAPSPPAIKVQPPSVSGPSSSTYQPLDQYVYTPPANHSPRSTSVPPRSSSGARKSVQFAESPLMAQAKATGSADLPSSSEQARRQHRSRRDGPAGGYEAGEDSDSTPDELRRGSLPEPVETRRQREERPHQRRRSHEPRPSSSKAPTDLAPDRDGGMSPASDATEELPPRFDKSGRRKMEPGEDPLADTLDGFLKGKVFGNFVDGLFGPDGRGGKRGGK